MIVPIGSVDNLEDLERDWANPNAVIEVDTSQGEPHYPAPQPLASEFYRLIQQAEFYIDFIFRVIIYAVNDIITILKFVFKGPVNAAIPATQAGSKATL